MRPRVRREALLLQEFPDETLVYDETAQKAHCLNATAAEVFRLADGTRDERQLATALAGTLRPAHRAHAPELVGAALREFGRAGLLEEALGAPGRSRRAALKRLGLGVLVPTVVSVLAPTPAEALGTCVLDCTGQVENVTTCAIDPLVGCSAGVGVCVSDGMGGLECV